jgi:hypothetical protein
MWLAARLAEEYILIDISLINCSPGLTNKSQQKNISSALEFLSASVRAERNTEYQPCGKP